MQTANYNNKRCSRSFRLKSKASHQFVYVKMETSTGSAGVRQYSYVCTTDCNNPLLSQFSLVSFYRGADKSLARPEKKQTRKHVRNARDFNNIETQAGTLQRKAPKKIHAVLTETLACFLPGRAKDLSATLWLSQLCYSVCDTSTFRHYAWTDPKSGFANPVGPTFGVVWASKFLTLSIRLFQSFCWKLFSHMDF